MSRPAHSMKFQISTLLFSTVLSMFSVPALARTACPGATINGAMNHLEPQHSNTIRVPGTSREAVGISDFADLTILGGLAAAPQLATVGATNFPNTYTGN